MEVKLLQKTEEERWNNFVDTSAQGCVFNKTWYLQAIGLTYQIYVVEKDKEIYAGMILGNRDGKWTFGPFQKYTGVLFAQFDGAPYTIETNRRSALRLLVAQCSGLSDYDYFFHPHFGNWLLFYHAGFKETTYYTYRIKVEGKTPDELLALYAPRLRSKIRKTFTDKEIVVVEDLDLPLFYEIINGTFIRKKEKVAFSLSLFKTICTTLNKHKALRFYRSVNKKGVTTSVLGVAYDSNAAYLLFSGYDEDQKDPGHNERLIHQAICDAAHRVKYFDFEGSMIPGVESYYRQFGGDFTPYFRIYKPSIVASLKEAVRKLR